MMGPSDVVYMEKRCMCSVMRQKDLMIHSVDSGR